MISRDEDALICDLAETYQIYNYRSLPARLVATFSVGLRDDSRIKLKMSNEKVSLQNYLLASIMDRLSLLVWFQTKDGQDGKNRPLMMVDALLRNEIESESDIEAFESVEEYEAYRNRLVGDANAG